MCGSVGVVEGCDTPCIVDHTWGLTSVSCSVHSDAPLVTAGLLVLLCGADIRRCWTPLWVRVLSRPCARRCTAWS